jgi:hypothetical protein
MITTRRTDVGYGRREGDDHDLLYGCAAMGDVNVMITTCCTDVPLRAT